MTNIHHECNEFTDAELRHICAASFHRLPHVCVCTIDADTKHNNMNTFYGTAAFIQSPPPTYPLLAVAVETACRAGENYSITVRGDNSQHIPSADKPIKHDLAEREREIVRQEDRKTEKVHCKVAYVLQLMLRQLTLQMRMVRHKDVDAGVCKKLRLSCNQELRKD